ncbi:hypothetical protein FB567DRAFT_539835 [Paraphoma chrysanthemicola]|uniref:Uncharacterized protein n=1 Tax=Paraphoma chrysanthemicola TaxID=798071 RepID=A0A8K0QTK4_9PLEO|nr:hypothetical protein FB567DRAFT_539835 [Paraphoma chrysanthemicola]
MAPIFVNPSAAVTRHTGKITQYLRIRAQQEYEEASLQLETKLRQSKDLIVGGKAYKDIGKAYNNFKTWHDRKPVALVRPKHRRRVEKASASTDTSSGCYREYFAERKRAEDKRIAWCRNSQARSPPAENALPLPPQISRPEHPKIQREVPKPEPQLSYMESVRSKHPPSEDPAKRNKSVFDMLASIPSLSNVTGVGAPSGHSGISDDPVLAKFNQDRHISHILELHQESQANQRAQWLEQQRQEAKAEAERQRKVAIFQHFCSRYDERVAKLVQLGPKFHAEMTKFDHAFEQDDLNLFCEAITALVTQVIEPAHAILQEMPAEIALETMGATELMNAWPLDKVDNILQQYTGPNMSNFNDETQHMLNYMMQGFHAICAPIFKAVPLANPLNQAPSQPFEAKPISVSFMHHPNAAPAPMTSQPKLQHQPQPQSESQPLAHAGQNADKNFASLADLIKSNAQAQVPAITITPPSFGGSILSGLAPTGTFHTSDDTSSGTTNPPSSDSNKVLVLKQGINDKVLDFQVEVGKLIKDGSVKASPRKAITDDLEWLDSYAGGETGLLGKEDCVMMKNEIRRVLIKIANLRDQKEKNKLATRELDVLANRVMKLWK